MNVGEIYNLISLSIAVLSGITITLSLYYLYLKIKSQEK